jgi:hypothetical protein
VLDGLMLSAVWNDFDGLTITSAQNSMFSLPGTTFIAQRFNIKSNQLGRDIGVLLGMIVAFRLIFAYLMWKFQTGKK